MKLKLVKVFSETSEIKTFYFETTKKVIYKPGQYFYITIPHLKNIDSRGNSRHFTLSSSPSEKLLAITTKIHKKPSGFKKQLSELSIGEKIEGSGPWGMFTFPQKIKPSNVNLFIAGGMGITPFRSMIKYNIDKKLKKPIYLIYFETGENFAFKNEIETWLGDKVTFVNRSKTNTHLIKYISEFKLDLKVITPWIVGPPTFVDDFEGILEQIGIESGKIQSEKFTGYLPE